MATEILTPEDASFPSFLSQRSQAILAHYVAGSCQKHLGHLPHISKIVCSFNYIVMFLMCLTMQQPHWTLGCTFARCEKDCGVR